MARILLGCTHPGRYPRWGYLDRLETNETMPRACVTTLALLALLAFFVFLIQSFWPMTAPDPTPLRPFGTEIVHLLPKPLPPPTIQRSPQPKVQIGSRTIGEVVPVDDAIGPQDEEQRTSPGGRDGPGDGDFWIESIGDGVEWGAVAVTPEMPRADKFIAVEHEPELLLMQKPRYPELARDAGIEGTVLVRALVGAGGSVLRAVVLQSVTGLDEAALEAVATASFRPAQQQGRPVAAWVIVPIQFSLRPCS